MSFLNELKLSLESQSESLKENEYSNLSMETLCNDIRYLAYSDPNIEYFGISTEGVKEFAKKTVEVVKKVLKWIKEKINKIVSMIIGFFSSKEREKKIEEAKAILSEHKDEIPKIQEEVVKQVKEQVKDLNKSIDKEDKDKDGGKVEIVLNSFPSYSEIKQVIDDSHKDKITDDVKDKIKTNMDEWDLKTLAQYKEDIPYKGIAYAIEKGIESFDEYIKMIKLFLNAKNKEDIIGVIDKLSLDKDSSDEIKSDINESSKAYGIVKDLSKAIEYYLVDSKKYKICKPAEPVNDKNGYHLGGNMYVSSQTNNIFGINVYSDWTKNDNALPEDSNWPAKVLFEKAKLKIEYNKKIEKCKQHIEGLTNELNKLMDSIGEDDFVDDFKYNLIRCSSEELEKLSSGVSRILSEMANYDKISMKYIDIINLPFNYKK